jgi:hypothetical protein
MRVDARVSVLAGRRDVDACRVAHESPGGGRGAVAEYGVGPAREHCRHRSGVWGGWEVSHGVHAAMHADQAPCLDPEVNLVTRQPRIEELCARDDSVLRGRFGAYIAIN